MIDFTEFEKKIGVTFKSKALLRQAFTHRSYINENRQSDLSHNERLEFLGDAVLELIITDHLYAKYPLSPEGELTSYRSALVNAVTMSEVASNLGVNNFLLLSRGEAKDTGKARQYILANTIEAIIGAIYIDQGYDVAKDFVTKYVFVLIDKIVAEKSWVDAKSLFQEKAQENDSQTPNYKTMREDGPDHDKRFTVGVYIGTELVAEGAGQSKQEAEQEAARKALVKRGWL